MTNKLSNNCLIRLYISYYFPLTVAARKLYITNRSKTLFLQLFRCKFCIFICC